jgi:L-rhamnose mutarotase
MNMIKRAMNMGRLKPEGIAAYLKAHDEIHPDFVNGLRGAGMTTISCFLAGVDLAVYSEAHSEGFEKGKEELAQNNAAREFGDSMLPLVEAGAKSIDFKEVFHMPDLTKGRPIGLEKRLLSMATLKHEAVPEYIRRHDEIKPELLDLFRQTGIIQISCFLHQTTLLIYSVRDETLYPSREEGLNHHPVCMEFMALMKPLVDPSGVSVDLPEVFRLP